MIVTTASTPVRSRPLPALIYVLAAGVFLMGTTEFIVAGILPEIADDLGITVANAGLTITVFAIGMIVGTPTMTALTLRLPRRVTLSLSLLVFAVGHAIVALSDSLAVILAARFLTALATGAFWAVAAVVAAKAAGPGFTSKALGIVLGGGMLANVIGVPLGSFAGQAIGWRGPFWALAGVAVVAAVVMFLQVPIEKDRGAAPSLRAELRSLRNGRVWLVFAGAAIVCGSSLAVYSFIAPLLTESSGLPASAVPLALVGYGFGALVGSNAGGSLGSKRPYGVLFVAATMTLLVLIALLLGSHNAVATIVLVVLLGLFGMATNPILIGMAVRFADRAPTLASALATSAFNFGTAVGSWIAGFALESALGASGPVLVGAVIAALYFLPLGVLFARERRGPAASARYPCAASAGVSAAETLPYSPAAQDASSRIRSAEEDPGSAV